MNNQASKKKFFRISSIDFLGAIRPKISKRREQLSKKLIERRAKLALQVNGN